jgi:cell division transport system permease protein
MSTAKPKREPQAPGAERDQAPRPTFASWREQHAYAALSSLGRMARKPGASLMTVLMMALVLLLPLVLALVVGNLTRLERTLEWPHGLSLFLAPGTKAEAARKLADALHRDPDVADLELRTPDQGRAELLRLPGFAPALALLDENPLPWVLSVTPASGREASLLAERLGQREGVAFVAQDQALGTRFHALAALLDRAARLAAVVFALAALLTVGNTIRLEVAARADEIRVLETVGAEPAFVRRPYLYTGVWFGGASALLALVATAVLQAQLAPSIAELAHSYGAAYVPAGLNVALVLATMAAGIVLGWIGARIAVALMLARVRPN